MTMKVQEEYSYSNVQDDLEDAEVCSKSLVVDLVTFGKIKRTVKTTWNWKQEKLGMNSAT